MIKVKECNSLEEVRSEIDVIDDQIANLIAMRNGYIKQAAKFKHSVEDVRAEERVRFVINRARDKGILNGVNPNLMEDIYRLMIEKMTETELAEFQNRKSF